jgi:hypothetical protein
MGQQLGCDPAQHFKSRDRIDINRVASGRPIIGPQCLTHAAFQAAAAGLWMKAAHSFALAPSTRG